MTDADQDQEQPPLAGYLKWYNPLKGFGFVVDETSNEDILLRANVLQKFGRNSIAEGAFIDFKAQKTSRGLKVAEILSIDPSSLPRPELIDLENLELSYIQTLPLEPARVKWFDSVKGFGFVNIYGKDTDVFIHIEILRRSGLTDLQAGEAIALRVIDGRRGKMAAELCSWDSAI